MAKTNVRRKKTKKKNISNGVVHIHSTYNNTIVTFADDNGDVISWSAAGANGFKGSKKSTPFAAQISAESATKSAMEHGLKEVRAELKGRGPGKDAAVKQIQVTGIKVSSIKDVTPKAHNGCRLPKKQLEKKK